jgi:hypothetical protein
MSSDHPDVPRILLSGARIISGLMGAGRLRPWTPLPLVGCSTYLAVLYSSGYWTMMVGATELGLSIILLAVAAAPAFAAVPQRGAVDLPHTDLVLMFALLALAFGTHNLKKLECVAWIRSFVDTRSNSFLVDAFRQTGPGDQSSFANLQTSGVHGGCVCLLGASPLPYVVFIVGMRAAPASEKETLEFEAIEVANKRVTDQCGIYSLCTES